MNPSGVNNSDRAGMGALKRFWGRIQGAYASTGSANAYVLTPTVALSAPVTGERYSFRANFTNTGSATLNISATGAVTIQKMTGSGLANLASGDIQSGQPVTVEYNGTVYIMTTPIGNTAGSGTVTSVATGVGLTGGPITGSGTIDFDVNNLTGVTTPAADDEIPVYDTSASGHRKITWENALKVINLLTADTNPSLSDVLLLYDSGASNADKITPDNFLKVINLLTEDASPDGAADFVVTYAANASGVKKVLINNLAAGGVFTESFSSAEQTITLGGALTIAHSLSSAPELIKVYLICKTAEKGYSIGDEVDVSFLTGADNVSTFNGMSVVPDSTNLNIRIGDDNRAIIHKTTGNLEGITNSSWRYIFKAWA